MIDEFYYIFSHQLNIVKNQTLFTIGTCTWPTTVLTSCRPTIPKTKTPTPVRVTNGRSNRCGHIWPHKALMWPVFGVHYAILCCAQYLPAKIPSITWPKSIRAAITIVTNYLASMLFSIPSSNRGCWRWTFHRLYIRHLRWTCMSKDRWYNPSWILHSSRYVVSIAPVSSAEI